MSKLSITTTFCAAALLSLWTMPLMAKTVNCNLPGHNLQKSIDNADIGDELRVVGTCNNGPFFVQKSLELVGPATLQAPNGDFATLQILGGTVTLTNLSVDASTNEIGIYVEGATARISGVHVHNALNEGMTKF